MATTIQIIGAVLVIAGIGLMSIPAALVIAGLAGIVFGIALERK